WPGLLRARVGLPQPRHGRVAQGAAWALPQRIPMCRSSSEKLTETPGVPVILTSVTSQTQSERSQVPGSSWFQQSQLPGDPVAGSAVTHDPGEVSVRFL